MTTLSPTLLVTFIVSVLLQIVGLSLLPQTRGFTNLVPTVSVSVCYIIALGLLARLISGGASLSVLTPLVACLVPLLLIFVGVWIYGESVSYLKLALLISSTVLVGIASKL